MKATFENTVDILVKAYFNGTLAHGSCTACAVGNLVAHAIGTKPAKTPYSRNGFKFDVFADQRRSLWQNVFISGLHGQNIFEENYQGEVKEQIDLTGYSWEELAKIEKAFESAPRNCDCEECLNEEWMFNGLMAVVDVLADIHGISLKQKSEAKAMCVK